jgi:hypothetical protein
VNEERLSNAFLDRGWRLLLKLLGIRTSIRRFRIVTAVVDQTTVFKEKLKVIGRASLLNLVKSKPVGGVSSGIDVSFDV